jgi:hypothetical protein
MRPSVSGQGRRRAQLSPHFSEGENTTAGWHSGAASLVLRVLKREFGASNCQKEVAPCSMRTLELSVRPT